MFKFLRGLRKKLSCESGAFAVTASEQCALSKKSPFAIAKRVVEIATSRLNERQAIACGGELIAARIYKLHCMRCGKRKCEIAEARL